MSTTVFINSVSVYPIPFSVGGEHPGTLKWHIQCWIKLLKKEKWWGETGRGDGTQYAKKPESRWYMKRITIYIAPCHIHISYNFTACRVFNHAAYCLASCAARIAGARQCKPQRLSGHTPFRLRITRFLGIPAPPHVPDISSRAGYEIRTF